MAGLIAVVSLSAQGAPASSSSSAVPTQAFCSVALQDLMAPVNLAGANLETHARPATVINDIFQLTSHLDAIDQTVKEIGLSNFGPDFDLNDSWCQGATAILDALFGVKFHGLKMMPVRTQPLAFLNQKHHTYERSEEPLANGEYLIVDGTIRQFFWPHIIQQEDQLVPQIFVGTESDLRRLFLTYLSVPGIDPNELATGYLQTQSVRKLAETDAHIASTLQPEIRKWIETHAAELEPRL